MDNSQNLSILVSQILFLLIKTNILNTIINILNGETVYTNAIRWTVAGLTMVLP